MLRQHFPCQPPIFLLSPRLGIVHASPSRCAAQQDYLDWLSQDCPCRSACRQSLSAHVRFSLPPRLANPPISIGPRDIPFAAQSTLPHKADGPPLPSLSRGEAPIAPHPHSRLWRGKRRGPILAAPSIWELWFQYPRRFAPLSKWPFGLVVLVVDFPPWICEDGGGSE